MSSTELRVRLCVFLGHNQITTGTEQRRGPDITGTTMARMQKDRTTESQNIPVMEPQWTK